MNPPDLDELLGRADAMPTLPEIVRHVMHSLNDEGADTDTLVHHLNTDPAIVARLLAAANSSAFGLATPIDSARQAFLVLGVKRVTGVILATALIQRFDTTTAHFNARQLWLHALGVATCARVLAERTGLNPETAFTAGLLHDIGQLLMYTAAPAAYIEALNLRQTQDLPISAAEQAVFGYDHARAGGRLAEAWKLPGPIADAIAAHHDPDAFYARGIAANNGNPGEPREPDEFGDLIHVSEILSHALDLGKPSNNLVPDLSERACANLGVEWPAIAPHFAEIEARYDSMRIALAL